MTSKTKLLKKGKNIPGNATKPAPANAENENTTTKNAVNARIFVKGKVITYDDALKKRKERDERIRARRYNALLKSGLTEDQAKEFMENLNIRTIMILPFSSFSVQDEMKKKKETEVPNILQGVSAVLKFLEDNKIEVLCSNSMAVYFNTVKDKIEEMKTLFKDVGRLYIHSWHPAEEKKEKVKKPTTNTAEVKKAAKEKRKNDNKQHVVMRPFYTALRKGGVSARIKKHNPSLAEKIEKWIEEQRASEASRKKGSKEERSKHRQLTSMEMKVNKRARKAAKHLATVERKAAAERKRQEANQKAKAAKIAAKPTQTELKMAA